VFADLCRYKHLDGLIWVQNGGFNKFESAFKQLNFVPLTVAIYEVKAKVLLNEKV
jgi:hypothetical protein